MVATRASRTPAGKTLQTKAFVSMMRTFGSSLMASRSLTMSPFDLASIAPMVRQSHLMHAFGH